MDKAKKVSALLHEAAETHHLVYRIVDGDDPDWASWYGDWLIELSELPQILGKKPVRSHLVSALVACDIDFVKKKLKGKWEDYYAQQLLKEFEQ